MIGFGENKKKRIGIGNSDFRKLLEKECYLVDKTKMVEDIINDASEVILFTRPRRFGKTLNMSMINEFFSIEKDSKDLFKNTYINNTKYIKDVNSYPTIFMTFKDCKGNTKEELLLKIYNSLEYIVDDITDNKNYYLVNNKLKLKIDRIYNLIFNEDYSSFDKTSNILKLLTQAYYEIYNQKAILIIDEYDTPMQSSYDNNTYNELKSFFTGLYSSVLKDNIYLEKGILTGIQRVSKESIFSGLNNIKVDTILDEHYNTYFGFTTKETEDILKYYNLELNEEVTGMYNGYNFGNLEIYNPWSIINYCDNKKLKSYWVNTASNEMLINSLKESNSLDLLVNLLYNNKLETRLNLDMSYREKINSREFFGLLLNSGYVTLDNESEELLIQDEVVLRNVNSETKYDLGKVISRYNKALEEDDDKLYNISRLLFKEHKVEEFFIEFKNILLSRFSYYNLKENTYQVLWIMFSLFVNTDNYEIFSELENGNGRIDLLFKAKKQDFKNIIIELKYSKSIDNLKENSENALNQININKYYSNLKGNTILLGVSHYKKECEYSYKEIEL